MQNDIDKSTPLYIAPANPAGRKLAKNLQNAGYNVRGFVDNLKQGDDIASQASRLEQHAKVILHEATYTDSVAAGLLQRHFARGVLWLCHTAGDSPPPITSSTTSSENANVDVSFSRYSLPLNFRWRQVVFNTCLLLFKALRLVAPKRNYVYYAEGFFDTNVLLAYREHKRRYKKEAFLLGLDLKQHIAELESDNTQFDHLSLPVLWKLCCAKRIIVDHEYTGDTFSLLRKHIPVIQLWHGLPYKALSGNKHYPDICDEAFVSSSTWFNNEIFPKIFRAKNYLALGYPRNDAFLQSPNERDWINTEPYESLKQIEDNSGSIIVYAPTYRDWGNNEYPIDLDAINAWCRKNKRAFVLKFHPFISRLFGEAMGLEDSNSLQQLPSHPYIYMYPSGKNIYPWLAEASALVTDYSSIAYDFLLANKPIVYFQYDKADYVKLRGATLVSDDDFIAGEVVESTDEMLKRLAYDLAIKIDEVAAGNVHTKRRALMEKFELTHTTSADHIVNYVRGG